uniref:Uncharacterized protein n=1 Tax=Lepeophtheirus salmonis TaxID=72036 RepID=A0A0K2U074_LEPSM
MCCYLGEYGSQSWRIMILVYKGTHH